MDVITHLSTCLSRAAQILSKPEAEPPNMIPCECRRCSGIVKQPHMEAVEDRPHQGNIRSAAFLDRLDMPASRGRHLLDKFASFQLDHSISHPPSQSHVEVLFARPMLLAVCHEFLRRSTSATAHGASREHADSAKDLGQRADDTVADRAIVAEARREDEVCVEAQIVTKRFVHGIDEDIVLAALLFPSP